MAASGEVDLQHQLADAHGLDFVKVVTDLHQDELPLAALGAAGAKFLAAEIARGQPLAHRRRPRPHAPGRASTSLPADAGAARPLRLADGRPHARGRRQPARDHQPPRRAHRRRGDSRCRCRSWPTAPATATCSLGQKDVAERLRARPRGCDLMLVGIGTAVREAELVASGMIDAAEVDGRIRRAGGVGEMLGHFFDAAGRPVETELDPPHRHPCRSRRLRGPPDRRLRRRRHQGRRHPRRPRERPPLRPHHRRAHRPRHRRDAGTPSAGRHGDAMTAARRSRPLESAQ